MGIKVKDVMSTTIKSILPEMNAKEALKILLDNDLSGIPVIDSTGKLAGVFTEREVLKSILPVYVRNVGEFVYEDISKGGLKKMAKLENFLVKDIMRQEVPTISEESSVTEASKIMLLKSERRIIVVRDGKPAGVITRCDVVKALAKEAGIIL